MLLTVLKHGRHWDILGRVFKIKGITFERMISKFVSLLSEHLYNLLVTTIALQFKMSDLANEEQRFSNYPEAYYAVDVTFQQTFRPSGAIEEGKLYFSGTHKLYGVKIEVSVLPNSFAVACSDQYPGSVSDFEIFQHRVDIHKSLVEKKEGETNMLDSGMHVDAYSE